MGSGRGQARNLLGQAPFRQLWIARTISQWGDAFNTVALALLVYSLTGTGIGVVGVVVAEIIPVFLLAAVAGTVIDRLPGRGVMIAADLARAALALILPLIDGDVIAVYAVAFGLSAGAVFFNPAANSLLPALVGNRELVAANSALWTAAVASQIVLAPLAGLVVVSFGYQWAFWINAASYVCSAIALHRLPPATRSTPTGIATDQPRRWYADALRGFAILVGDRHMRALLAAQFLAALSAGATGGLLVVLAAEHLELDASAYGFLLGAIGIGALGGPLLLVRRNTDPRRPSYVFGPFLLRAMVDLVLATFTGLGFALGALILYGVGTSTGAVTFNSLLQAETPEGLRGRVFAGFDLAWQSGRLISLLLGGLVAATLGIRAVYYLGACLLLAAAAVGWSSRSR